MKYFIYLYLLLIIKFSNVCLASSKKKRQLEHPTDDAAHIVPHHSKARAHRESKRLDEPGALGEKNIPESDLNLPDGSVKPSERTRKQGRLRFRSVITDAPAEILLDNSSSESNENVQVVSAKDVFNTPEESPQATPSQPTLPTNEATAENKLAQQAQTIASNQPTFKNEELLAEIEKAKDLFRTASSANTKVTYLL